MTAEARTGADEEISKEQFAFVKKVLFEKAGIRLDETKRQLVRTRLARRARSLRLGGIGAYLEYLSKNDSAESEDFVNTLTTNLTSFFRESHHFDLLAKLAEEQVAAREGSFRIWSSACSTGEEPYSIAMTLSACPAAARLPRLEILATDIDSQVLAKARAGVYEIGSADSIPPGYRRYLLRGKNDNEGLIKVAQAARSMVEFRQLNLMKTWDHGGGFDVVFCRNVLIYFDRETQKKLVDRLVGSVRPGGVLILGHSESIGGARPDLELIGRTAFRRKP